MEFARLAHQGNAQWCIVEKGIAYAVVGDLYANPRKGEALGEASGFKVLNCADPSRNKVICLLGNWGPQPDNDGSGVFIKPPNAMVDPGDPVIYPKLATQVFIEPELAVIIGRTCADVSVAQAKSYIFGYTIANDVTAFGMNKNMLFPYLFGKAFDGFCGLGPRVVTDIDPTTLTLRAALNGETYVEINTSKMTWNVFEIVSWISQVATLNPGDVIMMGAPPGFNEREVKPGDTMTVSIDGIGVLSNPMRAAKR